MSGVNVYNEANDKIGEISDVIITEQGQVKGALSKPAASLEWESTMCWSPSTA